jgi:hypothetical protein
MQMQEDKMPSAMAQERMHALLACGSVQERLAAEGKCLVPRTLVDAVAKDGALKANPVVRRDLTRFVASLRQGQ